MIPLEQPCQLAPVGDSDIANGPGPNGPANVSSLGLPTLNATDGGTQCGDADCPYERPCSQKGECRSETLLTIFLDFFDNWGRKYPAYAPFTTPVYSNIGFALLGLVIERASGSSYADFMQKSIISPLNLTGTSVNHPSKLEDAFVTAQAGDGDLSQDFLARWVEMRTPKLTRQFRGRLFQCQRSLQSRQIHPIQHSTPTESNPILAHTSYLHFFFWHFCWRGLGDRQRAQPYGRWQPDRRRLYKVGQSGSV